MEKTECRNAGKKRVGLRSRLDSFLFFLFQEVRLSVLFPVFEGEIINERVATGLLNAFLSKLANKNRLAVSQVLFSVPCGVTADIIDKYKRLSKNCNLGKTYFVEAPILSALGQRIPLNESSPCFVVDKFSSSNKALKCNGRFRILIYDFISCFLRIIA